MTALIGEKMGKYDDIINMPHHVSDRHPHMPVGDRAAQFAPFAALTGYGDQIDETARLTEDRLELTESERGRIDIRLQQLEQSLADGPAVQLIYFRQDPIKSGGAYLTAVGRVRRLDRLRQTLVMDDGTEIDFSDIYEIGGELFR